MKCVNCFRTATPAMLSFQGHEIGGWKCKCGEEYFDPGQAEKILTLNKLMAGKIEAKLGRIRSNLILRIPKAIEECMGLKEGEKVRLKVKSRGELTLSAA